MNPSTSVADWAGNSPGLHLLPKPLLPPTGPRPPALPASPLNEDKQKSQSSFITSGETAEGGKSIVFQPRRRTKNCAFPSLLKCFLLSSSSGFKGLSGTQGARSECSRGTALASILHWQHRRTRGMSQLVIVEPAWAEPTGVRARPSSSPQPGACTGIGAGTEPTEPL